MLLRLLKYDFRAMWKSFSLVWGAALALALVNRFALFRDFGKNIFTNSGVLSFIFCCVIMAMLVISITFVLNRFSKGLLGSEGYLMFTLPVRAWELVLSKLICGTVTWTVSGAVALLAALLMANTELSVLIDPRFWRDLFWGLTRRPDILPLMVEFCMVLLSAIVLAISVIYLAAAISHLASRHRKIIGVAAFIALYALLISFYTRVFSSRVIQVMLDVTTSNVHGSMLTAIAAMLIPAAVLLATTCWILENKLNLE